MLVLFLAKQQFVQAALLAIVFHYPIYTTFSACQRQPVR